jgi:hypothetical protein
VSRSSILHDSFFAASFYDNKIGFDSPRMDFFPEQLRINKVIRKNDDHIGQTGANAIFDIS